MAAAGLPLLVVTPKVDESIDPAEAPYDYLARIAGAKLEAVAGVLSSPSGVHAATPGAASLAPASPDRVIPGAILVADTMVVMGRDILDKPATAEDARATLLRLSGETHDVATRFVLGSVTERAQGGLETAEIYAETVVTKVTFRSLSEREVDAFVATGECFDKAGGYGIQGGAAGFVSRLEGSYTAVVGLPVAEVLVALRRAGLWL